MSESIESIVRLCGERDHQLLVFPAESEWIVEVTVVDNIGCRERRVPLEEISAPGFRLADVIKELSDDLVKGVDKADISPVMAVALLAPQTIDLGELKIKPDVMHGSEPTPWPSS
jgi:hypothetical protein